MNQIEIQCKIQLCRGQLSKCQSRSRRNTKSIEEIEHLMKNLARRRDAFIENRDCLVARASEISPDQHSSSIEIVYEDNVLTLLKGSGFEQALRAFGQAGSKLSKERSSLIRENTELSRQIRNLRAEIERLCGLLEQA